MKSEFGAPKELTSILQRKNRKINMRQKDLNFLDRNEFNYSPSKEVVEALKNFDINKLCFYTRIYDEGKKSILSVFLSELYDIDETQVLLGYGGEDILKQAVHYFLTEEDGNKTMLIPKFSWWYYKSIADEVNGRTLQYPLYEDGNTFKYDFAAMKDMIQKENPKILLLASPNNPTGNGLTPEELDELLAEVPAKTKVLIDEAYASFVSTDTRYIKELVNKYPNLIISRTLSKFYGLPGLRMGFGFMSKELEKFSKYSNKYLGYNRISEDIAIAALKSDAHYRNIAKLMNEDRARYEKEIGVLPGFKVYESVANFILIKYPIALKEALQKAFAEQSYKVKFMNEPDINTHLRITLGRPEQNRIVRYNQRNRIQMKAVILAAGIASRLRPLTDTTPKCLLKIGERCLLERAFDALIQNGFNEFIIVTGYRQQQIVDFLQAHYPAQSITFIYNDKYESTNNIYSLWLTRPYTEGEEVLLLDSDIVFDPQIVEKLLRSDKADVLALNRHELGAEEIKVIVDNEQKVVEISKVCSIPDAIGESIGIEKMSAAYTQALFRELEMMILSEGLDNIFYERAFERLIPQGYSFYVMDTTEFFSAELDTVEDFQQAQKLIPASLY